MKSGYERAGFELRNRGPWTVLSVSDWPGFILGQTTALGGGIPPSLHQPEARLSLYEYFDVRSVHEAHQIHGNRLACARCFSAGYSHTDGLFAARPRVLLTIRTADCYPVYLRERGSGRFGILHAGWRGLRERIVRKALDRWFSRPVDLLLGSGIGVERYTVGDDVRDDLSETFEVPVSELRKAGIFLEDRLDLVRTIQYQAERSDVSVSTYRRLPSSASEELPPMLSHRADGTEDRLVSWIARRDS